MEHLEGPEKEKLLNRILDFHMHCNMRLIDFFRSAIEDEDYHSFIAYTLTIGGQVFMSQNMGSSELRITIEKLLKQTKNEFKKFLLLCLYADLRLPNYAHLLENFLKATDKKALIEMGFVKIYELLVLYEGTKIPTSLISAFNMAFDKRQHLYGKFDQINLQRLRDRALQEAKRQHTITVQSKESE